MLRSRFECRNVRPLIGASHLEVHDAGIGQTDVRRSVIGGVLEHTFEDTPRPHDLIALERLERGASLHPRAMGSQQLFEHAVADARGNSGHTACKAISLAWDGLNVRLSIRSNSQETAQRGHRLLEAVVSDGHVVPDNRDQRVFGHDRFAPSQELEQDAKMALGNRQ